MQGSIIKSINLAAIEQLELPLIPKSTQEVYGNLFSAIVDKLQTIEKIRELEIKLQKQLVEQVSKM
jgi:restriction endonuclease S subunit